MPYIRKIELRGFKSFAKPVTITLDKGFTVISGPNGSGKTNILDAILFVLGELSARRMRAENLTSLIFHGSPEAKLEKAKSAKVVIQFDNRDGRIPVETETVTISREVFRNGQCIYRLNGRRVPRGRIIDVLSMAGISFGGHNVILQGTITRLADISSHERRKIIEDLIGIAQYDAEKAEAQEKLREAEIAIRTAMGRIDEVQKRIDSLERERNELLRFNFIQKEIKKFEAMKLSYEVHQLQREISEIEKQVEEVGEKVQKLAEIREKLRSERRLAEKEWRRLSSEMVEEGGSRVVRVQIKIGELRSKITELNTKIGAGNASLEGLRRVRENHLMQLENIRKEITENRLAIRRLKNKQKRLKAIIEEKQSEHDKLAKETAELWENLGENSKKLREIERKLEELYQKLADLKSFQSEKTTRIRTLSRRLKDLIKRKERFSSTLEELQKSLVDLEEIQKEQRKRFRSLQETLNRRVAQKEAVEREIKEAGKIAESAREAVVEFATQRELAETITQEEKALRNIEELGSLGVIRGVYGRLRNLIKIERGYERAVEVAAAGWLDALVVEDLDSAFTCAETLRRLKLGRIKIIPIREIQNVKPVAPKNRRGVAGTVLDFIKCSRRHLPAVHYVFGDTVIASDSKTAFELSREGLRAVTLDGDLYESGGALEGGYYRAPIDFSTIIPSESAIKSLDEAVRALKEHLMRREGDLKIFEDEIDKMRVEIARLSESIDMLEGEIARVKRNIKRTKWNLRRLDNNIKKINSTLEKDRTEIGIIRAQRNSIQKEVRKLRRELAELRRKTDPAEIQEMEVRRERLAEEIITLRQRLGEVETEISTLQSKYENVLRIGYMNAKVQLRKVEKQLALVEDEIRGALEQRESLKNELLELEKAREELAKTVLTAKDEAKKVTAQIDSIDKQLRKIDNEYEQMNKIYNQLQLKLQTTNFKLQQHKTRLTELGYTQPLKVPEEKLQEIETTLNMMRMELDRLGGVNQLALSHYAEQIARYKELSLRMNELEREKKAIIDFMEEIERKKREVFMDAFEKINKNLERYFEKLTGGGKAQLKLENPEDPFAGGVDMLVQFPGKPWILVSGASGGERSVAAVAFTFALQEFSPASFYIFDEVDAHLDAFHVERLSELFVEESEKAQFIVITLKPEMVNKAQKVYGVYSRNGVSNVISASFKEAG